MKSIFCILNRGVLFENPMAMNLWWNVRQVETLVELLRCFRNNVAIFQSFPGDNLFANDFTLQESFNFLIIKLINNFLYLIFSNLE